MEIKGINGFSDLMFSQINADKGLEIADSIKPNINKNESFKEILENKTNTNKPKRKEAPEDVDNYSIGDNKPKKENINKDEIRKDEHKENRIKHKEEKEAERKVNPESKEIHNKKIMHGVEKNSLKNRIRGIEDKIVKNTITHEQAKTKLKVDKLKNTKDIKANGNIEKLLFDGIEDKDSKSIKNIKNRKAVDFKDIQLKNKVNGKSAKTSTSKDVEIKTKTEQVVNEKQTIIKTESPKESINPLNINLDLSKEISSQDIKLEKTSNIRQLFEQYQEISDKILNKVDNVIKYMATKGTESVSIKLQPPELGKIHIEMTVKDHSINAKINTENIAVKEIIMSNLDQLKSGVENNGFNINKLDVEVGGFKNFLTDDSRGFNNNEGNNDNNSRGNRGNKSGFDFDGEVSNRPLNPYTFFIGRSVNMLV